MFQTDLFNEGYELTNNCNIKWLDNENIELTFIGDKQENETHTIQKNGSKLVYEGTKH